MRNANDAGEVSDRTSVLLAHRVYDPLLFEWRVIAAIAWEGYLANGAGHVAIDVGREVLYHYRPGAPCECHRGAVDDYDPETQVVVAVHFGDRDQVHCLTGWPTPPQAYGLVDAETLGAVVH